MYLVALLIAPDIVREQGQKLLKVMDLKNLSPEFKFAERDGKYKLMEINLRSMMWHKLEYGGVNINIHNTGYWKKRPKTKSKS